MKRSPRQRVVYLLSIPFAAAPFAFALARVFTTGSDFRFLWVAVASLLGAAAVMTIGKARHRMPSGVIALAAAALVVGASLAAATAWLLGARSATSIWFVSFGFALCWAVSYVLEALSRPRAARLKATRSP